MFRTKDVALNLWHGSKQDRLDRQNSNCFH